MFKGGKKPSINKDALRAPFKRIMIGTPSYDGKLSVQYTDSLIATMSTRPQTDQGAIIIDPYWIAFDALVCRARNDIFAMAHAGGYTDLIFIDADISWTPDQFWQIIMRNEQVVGGTYRKKNLNESYVLKAEKIPALPPEGGLMEVDGLGCGFLKFGKTAITNLFEASLKYTETGKQPASAVFEAQVIDGVLKSEDIVACERWRAMGEKVWLDPAVTVNHHDGSLTYSGDFRAWYTGIQNAKKSIE
jgi:hypothetical protein